MQANRGSTMAEIENQIAETRAERVRIELELQAIKKRSEELDDMYRREYCRQHGHDIKLENELSKGFAHCRMCKAHMNDCK